MKTILRFLLEKLLIEKTAYAHCDIPCGIYDPHQAQLAAHTVIRMTQLINDMKADINAPLEERKKIIHNLSRYTKVKEDHSNLLEEELDTLRNDYFKDEHFKEYPNLQELFVKTLKASAKARQEIDIEAAKESLAGAQEIAEIFFKTKGATPIRVKTVFPTGGEIVLHK
jgi:nickel superoxide dismutase